ncbi:MAG: 50S ribosomal protein L32 [Armatimonadetes bacterium]|nr:50S ribosomal protein L32 [Armatimonadota bacterium]
MPNPKYKTSHSKTRRRRSHLAIVAPNLVKCPQCHELKLSHNLCHSCGYYNKREVIKLEEVKK